MKVPFIKPTHILISTLLCAHAILSPTKAHGFIPPYISPNDLGRRNQHTATLINEQTNMIEVTYDVSCEKGEVQTIYLTYPQDQIALHVRRGEADNINLFLGDIGKEASFMKALPKHDQSVLNGLCRNDKPIPPTTKSILELGDALLQYFLQ